MLLDRVPDTTNFRWSRRVKRSQLRQLNFNQAQSRPPMQVVEDEEQHQPEFTGPAVANFRQQTLKAHEWGRRMQYAPRPGPAGICACEPTMPPFDPELLAERKRVDGVTQVVIRWHGPTCHQQRSPDGVLEPRHGGRVETEHGIEGHAREAQRLQFGVTRFGIDKSRQELNGRLKVPEAEVRQVAQQRR